MKVVESIVNRSEGLVFRELESIAADNGMRVFPKMRLSDVIIKENTYLTEREFDYYTRSHCDFVVTDGDKHPVMIVEYDGPLHSTDEKQQERDEIKNELCRRVALGILRINANYVTRRYRGMTVLRWIIEVTELEKAFNEAQEGGHIPWDEPFDPTFLEPAGAGGRFPYWLSATATQSFHEFFGTLDKAIPKGWTSIVGRDKAGSGRKLSCLYFGDKILWSTTGVRKQDLLFPDYDLMDEVGTCDLGLLLKKFRKGNIGACTPAEFRPVFERFCERYDAHPAFSQGAFPYETSWSFAEGWR